MRCWTAETWVRSRLSEGSWARSLAGESWGLRDGNELCGTHTVQRGLFSAIILTNTKPSNPTCNPTFCVALGVLQKHPGLCENTEAI